MRRIFPILIFALPCLAFDSYRITLPNGLKVEAEVAKDKEKGLQGRKSLCYNCGMVFVFEDEWYHGFWMKDTLINLAIIWINGDGEIVHIVKNAEPCLGKRNPYTECPIYSPTSPARYVLEINPEAASGIEVGMRIVKSDPPL
ncbi:MAG TPA: DUF192 domain-containing protein [Thermodesulfobacteriota bacterium]|jgi:hypothetical protein|nr:DUF192 domain-containing protein [Thermodesulfobacteriota bacterium]